MELKATLGIAAIDQDENVEHGLRGVAYAGAPFSIFYKGRRHRAVLDMASATWKKKTHCLTDHLNSNCCVIGCVILKKGDNSIDYTGRLYSDMKRAEEPITLLKEKHPLEASIGTYGDDTVEGASITKIVAGESVELNGRKYSGPILVCNKWQIREITILPLGQDPNTEAAKLSKGEDMPNRDEDKEVERLRSELAVSRTAQLKQLIPGISDDHAGKLSKNDDFNAVYEVLSAHCAKQGAPESTDEPPKVDSGAPTNATLDTSQLAALTKVLGAGSAQLKKDDEEDWLADGVEKGGD